MDAKQEIEKRLLDAVEASSPAAVNSFELAGKDAAAHLDVVGVVKSLVAQDILAAEQGQFETWELTAEGKTALAEGTLEARLFRAIDATTGTDLAALTALFGEDATKIAFGKCRQNKWVAQEKGGPVTRAVPEITDAVQQDLAALAAGTLANMSEGKNTPLATLKMRRMVEKKTTVFFNVTRGAAFTREKKELVRDLTGDMLKQGADVDALAFKPFNYEAEGRPAPGGALHPLGKVRCAFRDILMGMGFAEMPTNNFVESSFWNFDSLFQPQQHPARDAHDTFFLSSPATADVSTVAPADYFARVKAMHEAGGAGSIGYRYDWKAEEACKNILRTHTTASSSRMLHKLAEDYKRTGVFTPAKLFSIDRVFRNETLDATHLAEFHQVEGLIADRGLTLGHLIATIREFFAAIGITNCEFKPAYNPYTEPSMEIFAHSEELGKDMEIGNSGVFRPEMLAPMGLPEDVRVIAWGLSLERPTMLKYGLNNIRDLVGPKMQLRVIQNNPIARY